MTHIAQVFTSGGYAIRPVLRAILQSREFGDEDARFARYSWPVEFVVRAIKETGWTGFSVNDALTPLSNMGQQLFEPPDVNGWEIGPGWFSSGATLARMNFAATLAANQKTNLRNEARTYGRTPQALLSWALDKLSVMPYESGPYNELLGYLRTAPSWSGSDAELLVKAAGLVHLVLGSPEYQFV